MEKLIFGTFGTVNDCLLTIHPFTAMIETVSIKMRTVYE